MAKIVEENLIIRVSSITRDGETVPSAFDQDAIDALETAISDMVGDSKVVEIIRES